jgi:hypothetical protein
MRRFPRYVPWLIGLALVLPPPSYAKAPLEKIVVSGPGLEKPQTVTDGELLKLANPWFGHFADWGKVLPAGSAGHQGYEVVLYARLDEDELKPVYRSWYLPSQGGQSGQIYLPGKGEPAYQRNVSSILREGNDGHWQAATPEWESGIKRVLTIH